MVTPSPIAETIAERTKTHGDYKDVARVSQATLDLWRTGRNWKTLTDCQRETLQMIAHKVARILAGNANEPDHWRDLSGYSTLIERQILESQK